MTIAGLETGELVKRVRIDLGLTQEGLARHLGVSFVTVNGWENGRHRPSPGLARRLDELAAGSERTDAHEDGADSGRLVTAVDATTGWELHPKERCDFFHRIRRFPESVAEWRRQLVLRVLSEPELFPVTARARNEAWKPTRDEVVATRELVDAEISILREIARITAILYGSPRLGNHEDPVDELVYIILSCKAREGSFQDTFRALKARFDPWDELLEADDAEIARLIPGGLAERKVRSLRRALGQLKERFGHCTLEPARSWSEIELETFLCSLPEVSRKSAYCVMLFSFDRQVFPVDTHVGRVLARLGPYRQLGLELEELDHKKRQAILADLVPSNLRHGLHVNLLSHGRDVCRARKPLCSQCELRPLCGRWRRERRQSVESTEAPLIADLFCGAGGLSTGFEDAGFRVGLAADMEPPAVRSFKLNHPTVSDASVLEIDLRELSPADARRALPGRRRTVDVLVGAPPCVGFSSVGQRSKMTRTGYRADQDERNFLYRPMMQLVESLRPKLVLMENVVGMKSARSGAKSFLATATKDLTNLGYRTDQWTLNAMAFGVPQDRVRIFLVGARGKTPLPRPPVPAYQNVTRAVDIDALPPITFEEATFDLPPLAAGEGYPVERRPGTDSDPRFRRYLDKFKIRSGSRLIFGHWARYHNDRDIELYGVLQPGEDSVHALERHGRSDLMRYRADIFDDKYHRLRPDRPCKTIVSHLAKDGNGYIHPGQVRSISFREAARIQSFPDDFIFCGSPTDQWKQLGNAVPPLLARAIGAVFMQALRGKRGVRT